ncbi:MULTISPECIES: LysR family transcriptional regulator [unclassified Rathayibacter]|uniref:LysR family transcriptional regulator n=1 Tax=unclassified Rathayibacter TaxID=2609250 RepID=UPI000CE887B4|nr:MULTISPECIES: LysR family transcriptional regulator [unclassified Rathayibacter]PPF17126.1 LysR family transcriptional regulator [Rathayibacter sp. AY1A4]PPF35181.1 LysR family transcriptional regulator [Rathayibacter sp. AY1A3]PPG07146.1 LysR family transcriptional regulator [Rathayibacter sp. AY2B1]PPG69357.1 LysR family transcriptional regulator [Rathayibacter sp. AY1F4]PPG80072.1 LysR family transcriptional regulator [Rathayibacter sp. AY1E5]
MDVRRLELLRELSMRRSITAVAEATHRTPSAVSQQLKVLEREAGVPLIERSGRGVVLTAAGRELARSATEIAIALERADAVWQTFKNNPIGEVTIATFPTAGQMLLPNALVALRSVEGLVVQCEDADPGTDEFADLTADFDIVLAHSPTGRSAWAGRGLAMAELMVEPLDIGLPAGHRLADRATVSAADLVGETWIGVPDGFPFERVMQDIETASGEAVRVEQRFASTRVTEAFVAAGLGIAVLPRYTAGGAGVVVKPLRGVNSVRHIVALMRPDRAERLSVRTVVRELRAQAGRLVHAL